MVDLISLGAGVQSSTMALMAAHGELTPMPTAAIFADTQAEPPSVYDWLAYLEKRLPFPVIRVTKGSLQDEAEKMRISAKGKKYSKTAIPFFTVAADGSRGRVMHRSCTRDFKIRPLTKAVREIVGRKVIYQWWKDGRDGGRQLTTPLAVQWIGISLDEYQRQKPAREPWIKTRWPLIERRMTREHCLAWMEDKGYPRPPRSACIFCPFHSGEEWHRLKTEEPEEFARAVEFEKKAQERRAISDNFASTPFLHRSCKPLDTIDFSPKDDGQLPLWQDECEGMCGV